MEKGGAMKRLIYFFLVFVFVVFTPLNNLFASEITKINLINLTNKERIKAGIPILYPNYKLSVAAQNKANDMIQKGYWEHFHNGKAPWDWMREAGYEFSAAGENLAIDFLEAEPLIKAWMDSPTHRQNILNANFREIGIGIAKGYFKDHNTIIVVQMFGKPKETDINYSNQIAGVNGGFSQETSSKKTYESQAPANFWIALWKEVKDFFVFIKDFTVNLFRVS